MTVKRNNKIEQTESRPQWVDYLEHRFDKKLWRDDWRVWLGFIGGPDSDNGLGSEPSDYEILSALQMARTDDSVKVPSKITVDTVIKWIKIYRWKQRSEREGYKVNTKTGRILDVKARMQRAETFEERWDLLCDNCKTSQECYEVQEWARNEWPDWDREIDRVVAELRLKYGGTNRRGWE
jgi:hypothetical protein